MSRQAEQLSAIINVQNLCLELARTPILSSVSFAIEPGQFVGLIGPNGAGKSSLLRCLYRYLNPLSGAIELLGRDINNYSRVEYAKKVAVVLQELPEHFNLTVFDVVAMGITPHKPLFAALNKADIGSINDALEQVGLAHKAKQAFAVLSGGEKQRILIAKAMVQNPVLLIMDEPTSHLDVKYQIQLMELAKSLNVTVLASFHDLNLAAAISDTLLVMKEGKLIANGTPIEVITCQLLSDVFGVCAQVNSVPSAFEQGQNVPYIRYYYGYQK